MDHLDLNNSLQSHEIIFLQKILSEEGLTSLLTTAERLHIPAQFILQKTLAILLKQKLEKMIPIDYPSIPTATYHIPVKLNERFEQSIQKIIEYKPIKKKISSISTLNKQKISFKQLSPIFKNKIKKTIALKKIRIYKNELATTCKVCSQPLFKAEKLVGCYCISDLTKNVDFSKDSSHYVELTFSSSLEQDEIQTVIETLRIT